MAGNPDLDAAAVHPGGSGGGAKDLASDRHTPMTGKPRGVGDYDGAAAVALSRAAARRQGGEKTAPGPGQPAPSQQSGDRLRPLNPEQRKRYSFYLRLLGRKKGPGVQLGGP